MSSPDTDPLDAKLQAWKVRPSIPADFRAQVWQRIGARQREMENSAWMTALHHLSSFFAQPRYATATIILSLVLGAGLAKAKVEHEKTLAWQALEARYAESINPVAKQLVAFGK